MHEVFVWVTENTTLTLAIAFLAPSAFALLVAPLAARRKASAEAAAPAIEEPAATTEPAAQVEAPIAAPEPAADAAAPAEVEVPAPAREPAPPVQPPRQLELIPEPEPAAEPLPEPEPVRVSLRERLARTSEALVGRLGGLLGGRKVDADLLEELEMLLFTADLGVSTAESLLESVRQKASGSDGEAVREVLHASMLEKLERVQPQGSPLELAGKPHVVLVLGVNGSGKTTTIGKLAARYAAAGKHVVLGAGDTFRAAAIDQLQVWGERVGCEVIAGQPGGDPAAVAFDTIKAAIARDADVAIVDTAGRLQTKKPLMEELGKIVRVLSRDLPDAPHEVLLVLDANTGQNALSQARLFTEVTNVTGLALTKLDGSAKGGVIVGLADEFGIPVRYVGVGEGIDDLRDFDAREFVDALFGTD
jgi:fused signal recognition particle receptor